MEYGAGEPVPEVKVKKAFTLIELLVVIAIIAILAAILFPVFAQAKAAAKKTQCLSNVRQLNSAWLMYANDYDDTWVMTGKRWQSTDYGTAFGGNKNDFFYLAQPYVKNYGIFYCPERMTTEDAGDGSSSDDKLGRLFGYGMNYGPYHNRAGYGLFHMSTYYDKSSSLYKVSGDRNDAHMFPGRNLSEIVTPAAVLTLIDTGDDPQYTNSPYNMCDKASCPASVRHGGKYQVGFVDGHATSWDMKQFRDDLDGGHDWLLEPSDPKKMAMQCYDPSARMDSSFDTSLDGDIAGLEFVKTCQEVVDYAVAHRVAL